MPLLALVALRAAVPLVVLVAPDRAVPGLPPYDYRPLNGDSFGFYSAAREFIGTSGSLHPLVLLALAGCLAAAAWAARRLYRDGLRWQAVAFAAVVVALTLAPVIARMAPTGAAVLGWSLVWALPMLPWRAAGLPLDADVAFAFGLVLSLVANGVAVVATAYVGFRATGRRSVGLAAAALLALWPLLAPALAGRSAWRNGQWSADVGLHLYTEPLSTALVAVALALLLSPRLDDLRLALAGVALGYATFTKLSDGLVAVAAALVVAGWIGPRRTLPLVAGGLALVPLVAAYWANGYPELAEVPDWSAEFAARNWGDSLVFEPPVLLALLVPALAGAVALRHSRALPLLAATIGVTAALYSFYEVTWLHPRFLYVALPAVFVLAAAGVEALATRSSTGLARHRRTASSP